MILSDQSTAEQRLQLSSERVRETWSGWAGAAIGAGLVAVAVVSGSPPQLSPYRKEAMENGWYFDATTPLLRFDEPASEQLIPYDQQAQFVSSCLTNIGKSKLARLIGISRQVLYDWLKGTSEPQGENAARLALLARALDISNRPQTPLFKQAIVEPILDNGPSLLALLIEQEWDETQITAAARRARAFTEHRNKAIARARPLARDERTFAENQFDNALAEGLEG